MNLKTDILILEGAVTIDEKHEFQILTNSSTLVPTKEPMTYGSISRVGGTNTAKRSLQVAGFIPMAELREKVAPEKELLRVEVNSRPVKAVLFTAEENKNTLSALKNKFNGNRLLETQTGPTTPNLWIPPTEIKPGEKIEFRYDLKPRCCIKVN